MGSNIYTNPTSNSTMRKKTATKACKAQAPTTERQKVFIHGQKKKKREREKKSPFLYKNAK